MSNPSAAPAAAWQGTASVCRSNQTSPNYNVLSLVLRYTLTGQVFSRVTYAEDSMDTALFDRSNYRSEYVYPLRNVVVRLCEANMDPDLDPPVAETRSGTDGVFAFVNALDVGVEYKLVAILRNEDEKLLEERVTVDGIRVRDLPLPGEHTPIPLKHRNHTAAAGDRHIPDETEDIEATLETSLKGVTGLHLGEEAALLFDTFLLGVPYINQNRNSDGTVKQINIDNIGGVSGGILCFPTSMAMMMSYYGQGNNTTQSMAELAYQTWGNENYPHRQSTTGLGKYKFTYGNTWGGNVWEWWVWENRAARDAVGLALQTNWGDYKKDMEGKDAMPGSGEWQTFWEQANILGSGEAQYVRRHMGRGWPIIVGTNLTGAGHIILMRGVVVRTDGRIHKFIMNNPWGQPGANEARAIYYDTSTTGQTGAALTGTSHLTLRRGMTRDKVRDDCIVHGETEGA